jgi:glycosyltransferase involved in cell wall biosynthesis
LLLKKVGNTLTRRQQHWRLARDRLVPALHTVRAMPLQFHGNQMSPMISCLMVTQPLPERLPLLQRSISDYCRQSYLRRELVVVVDVCDPADAAPVRRVLESFGREDLRLVLPPVKLSLGALRNLSWQAARGEVVCQWDDDDMNHPERLTWQWGALRESNMAACYLEQFMQFFPVERSLYRVNFRPSPDGVAVNTLMAARTLPVRYPEVGPTASLGEDAALLAMIRSGGGFHVLADEPCLFVYVSHGANTWDHKHHRMLVDMMGASQALLRRMEPALRTGLAPYDFGADPVTVMGRNGPAFTLP